MIFSAPPPALPHTRYPVPALSAPRPAPHIPRMTWEFNGPLSLPPQIQQVGDLPPPARRTAGFGIDTQPLIEREKDGIIVIRPAGARRLTGHHASLHGIGGPTDHLMRFYRDMARGKYADAAMCVLAPQATALAPRRPKEENIKLIYEMLMYLTQQPKEVRAMFLAALKNGKGNLYQTLTAPPLWNAVSFATTRPARLPPTPGMLAFIYKFFDDHAINLSFHSHRTPDQEAILPLITACGDHVAPAIRKALVENDAVPGHISVSGFSQGVGPAVALAIMNMADVFHHLTLFSASYYKGAATPPNRNRDLFVDVLIPSDDLVPGVAGFTPAKIARDLQEDFPGRHRLVTKLRTADHDDAHSVSGHVAHAGGLRIATALRRGSTLARPPLAVSLTPTL